MTDILIIGAGIIGCAIARELARQGASVTVLETQPTVAAEASGAAVGTLSYSPSAPMPDGWHLLARESLAAHERLRDALSSEIENPPIWHFPGRLNLATTNAAEKNARERFKADRALGDAGEWLDKAAIHALEPALAPAVQGGSFKSVQGWVDSVHLTRALAASATQAGAQFLFNQSVTGLAWGGERVIGAITVEGTYKADVTILAAGAWAGQLDARVALPIEPIRGQALHITLNTEPPIRHLISGNGIYIIPDKQGVTIGATHENVGFQRGLTVGGMSKLLNNGIALLPILARAEWNDLHGWSGFRPATPDKTPILGPDPRAEGLWWATGHFRSGVLLAPITATLMREALSGNEEIKAQLLPERFM